MSVATAHQHQVPQHRISQRAGSRAAPLRGGFGHDIGRANRFVFQAAAKILGSRSHRRRGLITPRDALGAS